MLFEHQGWAKSTSKNIAKAYLGDAANVTRKNSEGEIVI
jgi:hypothetical protein